MLKYYSLIGAFTFGAAISISSFFDSENVQYIDMSDYTITITAGE